jgi:transposase
LICVLWEDPTASYEEIAHRLNKGRSTIYRTIGKLREEKRFSEKAQRKPAIGKYVTRSVPLSG